MFDKPIYIRLTADQANELQERFGSETSIPAIVRDLLGITRDQEILTTSQLPKSKMCKFKLDKFDARRVDRITGRRKGEPFENALMRLIFNLESDIIMGDE